MSFDQKPVNKTADTQVSAKKRIALIISLAVLLLAVVIIILLVFVFPTQHAEHKESTSSSMNAEDIAINSEIQANSETSSLSPSVSSSNTVVEPEQEPVPSLPDIPIIQDFRPSFVHGEKTAAHQKYIMLHDTEGEGSPSSVINYWDNNGNLVAAHFIVGKDGSIYQCAPLDTIVHHAGYGDAGHNKLYGVEDESRDDKRGTTPIGSWAPDYGMNSWSIGIEMVHVGGSGYYPEAQLNALDQLIAYIDAYYGFKSDIIDHKAWRSGNSDTSPEFAQYLENYQTKRTHT